MRLKSVLCILMMAAYGLGQSPRAVGADVPANSHDSPNSPNSHDNEAKHRVDDLKKQLDAQQSVLDDLNLKYDHPPGGQAGELPDLDQLSGQIAGKAAALQQLSRQISLLREGQGQDFELSDAGLQQRKLARENEVQQLAQQIADQRAAFTQTDAYYRSLQAMNMVTDELNRVQAVQQQQAAALAALVDQYNEMKLQAAEADDIERYQQQQAGGDREVSLKDLQKRYSAEQQTYFKQVEQYDEASEKAAEADVAARSKREGLDEQYAAAKRKYAEIYAQYAAGKRELQQLQARETH